MVMVEPMSNASPFSPCKIVKHRRTRVVTAIVSRELRFPRRPGPEFAAIAGKALSANVAAMSAAAKSTKIVCLNVPPPFSSVATAIDVCCCPIVFLLLVEGAGLGLFFFLPPPVYWLQG